jgi:hypothetical protein
MTDLSRATRHAHSVNPRQFMDATIATLSNGQRIIHVHNSSGLTFTILPDRGMDMWTAQYNGLPLTWISQNAPHKSDYGSHWLRQFNGGLLTTCGFTHVGFDETDALTGEFCGLHGNATRLSADDVAIRLQDDTLTIRATLAESRLFGEQIRLERTYTLTVGEPTITLQDTLTNVGDMPVPFMLLYHFNVGYPLVRVGTQLHTASQVVARNAHAQKDLATWQLYPAPIANYEEQVYFHHPYAENDQSAVLLENPDLALLLEWDTTHSPYFTQWKNTREGIYVCGIEPGNCVPEGRNNARERDVLVMLAPNESQHFCNTLTLAHMPEKIATMRERITHLRDHGTLLANCQLPSTK